MAAVQLCPPRPLNAHRWSSLVEDAASPAPRPEFKSRTVHQSAGQSVNQRAVSLNGKAPRYERGPMRVRVPRRPPNSSARPKLNGLSASLPNSMQRVRVPPAASPSPARVAQTAKERFPGTEEAASSSLAAGFAAPHARVAKRLGTGLQNLHTPVRLRPRALVDRKFASGLRASGRPHPARTSLLRRPDSDAAGERGRASQLSTSDRPERRCRAWH